MAKAVGAEQYHQTPRLQWSYCTYWSDLPVNGFETTTRPDRGWAAPADENGPTMLVLGWPFAEAMAYKADFEAHCRKTLELSPDLAARVAGATREEPFAGGAVRNFFRTPSGLGWALVGDTGYTTRSPRRAQ